VALANLPVTICRDNGVLLSHIQASTAAGFSVDNQTEANKCIGDAFEIKLFVTVL